MHKLFFLWVTGSNPKKNFHFSKHSLGIKILKCFSALNKMKGMNAVEETRDTEQKKTLHKLIGKRTLNKQTLNESFLLLLVNDFFVFLCHAIS